MQTSQGAFNEHRIKCDSLYTMFIENRENIYDERFRQINTGFEAARALAEKYERAGDVKYALEYIHMVQRLENDVTAVLRGI